MRQEKESSILGHVQKNIKNSSLHQPVIYLTPRQELKLGTNGLMLLQFVSELRGG